MAKPFVKWAGGKSALVPEILSRMPERIFTYFEPFVGGGALFFALAAEKHRRYDSAVLSDKNSDLVQTYHTVRDDVEELIETLRTFKYEKKFYYEVRERNRSDCNQVEWAARFIYLNRTCFNGLYRVNSKGKFNVPIGRYKNPRIVDEAGLRAASLALQNVDIHDEDFSIATRSASRNDFIYFDPPYVPTTKTSSFTAYTVGGFSSDDQKRLAMELSRLRDRSISFILSNADTPEVRELYSDFEIDRVEAVRAINSKVAKRGKVYEVLVR